MHSTLAAFIRLLSARSGVENGITAVGRAYFATKRSAMTSHDQALRLRSVCAARFLWHVNRQLPRCIPLPWRQCQATPASEQQARRQIPLAAGSSSPALVPMPVGCVVRADHSIRPGPRPLSIATVTIVHCAARGGRGQSVAARRRRESRSAFAVATPPVPGTSTRATRTSAFSDAQPQQIEDRLNQRPRKRLGYRAPQRVFDASFKRVALRS